MSSTKQCLTVNRQSVPDHHPDRRYLWIKEAAEYLRATEWFMYSLTWKRAIPFMKIGKRLVFDRIDLDNYMQNAKVGTA